MRRAHKLLKWTEPMLDYALECAKAGEPYQLITIKVNEKFRVNITENSVSYSLRQRRNYTRSRDEVAKIRRGRIEDTAIERQEMAPDKPLLTGAAAMADLREAMLREMANGQRS